MSTEAITQRIGQGADPGAVGFDGDLGIQTDAGTTNALGGNVTDGTLVGDPNSSLFQQVGSPFSTNGSPGNDLLVAQSARYNAPSTDNIRAGRGILTVGSQGASVQELHNRLGAIGFNAPSGDAYTAETASAVRAFQTAYRLQATGDVGQTTLSKLDASDGGFNGGGTRLFPEGAVASPNYPVYSYPGVPHHMTATGGFQEPHHDHSYKGPSKAIFGDSPQTITNLPGANRNLGIDYTTSDGLVRPWWGGRVTQVGWEGSYGNRIHVETDITYRYNGQDYRVQTAYAHAESYNSDLQVGSRVEKGENIGVMGGTGGNYGAHVDLRIWIDVPGQGRVDLSPNAIREQRLDRGLTP
ncbi:MAG: peptidoglycan DD-metalloendopeptidase family protein [Acidobacteriota bacterium]